MNYNLTAIKLDQLVTYLNQGKINLSPAFQRGHVWPVKTRSKLIANMILGRPIPAIFLYKEPAGARFSYNILDGKQRIESLILFVGTGTPDLQIPNWGDYFFEPEVRKQLAFKVELPTGKRTFKQLDPATLAVFGEYSIPTIEINLTDGTHLDEIIDLFVDINQQGVAVSRFQIVKAMGRENELLQSSFDLIALQQTRGADILYKAKTGDFGSVLRKLSLVAKMTDNNAAIDRMWERLLEIALFLRTREHQKPVEVLKRFIRSREPEEALSKEEVRQLRRVFKFLRKGYKSKLVDTRLATDQTHFYTMVTALIFSDLLDVYTEAVLTKKLTAFGRVVDGGSLPKEQPLAKVFEKYLDVSSKQTTDVSRRQDRQRLFIEAIRSL